MPELSQEELASLLARSLLAIRENVDIALRLLRVSKGEQPEGEDPMAKVKAFGLSLKRNKETDNG